MGDDMRVLVAGWLRFDGADCAEIIRGGHGHILASRAEAGCVAYDWSVDPLEPSRINVFEEWETPQALGAHFRDPSYWAMRGHLETYPLIAFDVKLYGATGVEPVYSDAGELRDTIFGIFIGEG